MKYSYNVTLNAHQTRNPMGSQTLSYALTIRNTTFPKNKIYLNELTNKIQPLP